MVGGVGGNKGQGQVGKPLGVGLGQGIGERPVGENGELPGPGKGIGNRGNTCKKQEKLIEKIKQHQIDGRGQKLGLYKQAERFGIDVENLHGNDGVDLSPQAQEALEDNQTNPAQPENQENTPDPAEQNGAETSPQYWLQKMFDFFSQFSKPAETPVEETPVEGVPVEAPPAAENPVTEPPVEEPPAFETPVVETPIQAPPAVEEPPPVETPETDDNQVNQEVGQ
jgi:hypothetical protein